MKYLRVGLIVAILSVALAGSLLAISDQMRTKAATAGQTGGFRPIKLGCANTSGAGGCSGGCGGHGEGGMCAADQLLQAKKTLAAAGVMPCAKTAKGVKCDPKTCADCAKAAAATGKTGALCPAHATTAASAKPAASAAMTCPMQTASAAAPKLAAKPAGR